ncbi:putative damage-inducible protein DinB [Scopulibacillus darangshiensis]|uniref:Putative damage-inducible protein DinB n=1 Tax=Scopulibacillus darangshiensis TaxID=442528 RepID=A0A4R2P3X9_9BACL|nr:DinB family protein [Scopulibacillus darangshiensis]TCP29422.1 putative damage-inducible protein DinB [Scopulibacillus darangshiensis]
MNYAIDMYGYNVWANKTIINRLKELPNDVYQKEITSVFPSVSSVLAHIYIADRGWLGVLSGKEMKEAFAMEDELRERTEKMGIEEMETMFNDLSEQYKAFLEQNNDLDKKTILNNTWTGKRETSLSEIVLHVVNHGTYHRGNITAMLRQMGHASVMTDYGLYWYSK